MCGPHARSGCAVLRAHLSPLTALSLTGATASLAWTTACPGSHPGPRPSLPPLQSSTFPLSVPQPPSSFLHPSPRLPRSRPEPLHSNAPSPSCARTPKLHQPAPASSSLLSLRHPFRSTLQACKVSVPERIRLAIFPPKAEALSCVLPALSPRPGVRPTAASVTTAAQQGPGELHGCFPPLS